jgi:hypothetical protein
MKLRIEVEIGDVPDLDAANLKLATMRISARIERLAEEIVDEATEPVLVPIGVVTLVEIVE